MLSVLAPKLDIFPLIASVSGSKTYRIELTEGYVGSGFWFSETRRDSVDCSILQSGSPHLTRFYVMYCIGIGIK